MVCPLFLLVHLPAKSIRSGGLPGIHKNNLDCKIFVGGAVLTPEYAKEIHADFYAKDAKESVDIAKKILG